MARIIGGVTSSHIPAVGNAIADGLTQTPYWKRFFDGYEPAKAWLRKHQPDIAIVVYNDHGLNFFLDKVPTFALGCADTYSNADEGWALKPVAPFKGNVPFSWHIAEKLVEQEFDICTCQEMKVDHGFVNPVRALWGTFEEWPITTMRFGSAPHCAARFCADATALATSRACSSGSASGSRRLLTLTKTKPRASQCAALSPATPGLPLSPWRQPPPWTISRTGVPGFTVAGR